MSVFFGGEPVFLWYILHLRVYNISTKIFLNTFLWKSLLEVEEEPQSTTKLIHHIISNKPDTIHSGILQPP